MIKCKICNNEFKSQKYLSTHIRFKHNLKYKEYYDLYVKQENEGICKTCGNPTNFDRGTYRQFCSVSCMRNNPEVQDRIKQTSIERHGGVGLQSKSIKKKMQDTCLKTYGVINPYSIDRVQKNAHNIDNIRRPLFEFEQENDCTWIRNLTKIYGHGWLKYLKLDYIYYKGHRFVKNDDIHLIEDYCKNRHKHFENSVIEYIRNFYNGKIDRDNKKLIKPLELDMYFPELNLAIECNGSWWHSIEAGIYDKYYHLSKTIACEKLGIRLIHIFEDDWFNNKIQLKVKSAILQTDTIDSSSTVILDRSNDDILAYLNLGYRIIKVSEPKKIDCIYTVYNCGMVTLEKLEGIL